VYLLPVIIGVIVTIVLAFAARPIFRKFCSGKTKSTENGTKPDATSPSIPRVSDEDHSDICSDKQIPPTILPTRGRKASTSSYASSVDFEIHAVPSPVKSMSSTPIDLWEEFINWKSPRDKKTNL
jgi:hypothetical protein